MNFNHVQVCSLFIFFFNNYIYLSLIDLHYRFDFYYTSTRINHISTRINHRCTFVCSLLKLPFTSHPFSFLQVITEPQFECTESYRKFPLAIYLTYVCVYASMPLSPFFSSSPSYPLPLSISLFSMSASPLLPCKQAHQYHLYRFHNVLCVNV